MDDHVATVARLLEQVRGRRAPVVALDGPGRGGKTTLANQLLEAKPGLHVVHMDDFYRPMPDAERAGLSPDEGYHRYFDWERLRDDVLEPLRLGGSVIYRRYDWATGGLGETVQVEPNAIVLVEGVYASRPELRNYYDLVIFLTADRDECLRRARVSGENSEDWIMRWRAAEDFYLDHVHPQAHADLVIRGEAQRSSQDGGHHDPERRHRERRGPRQGHLGLP